MAPFTPFFDCRDELGREDAALDGALEDEPAARFARLDVQHDVAILTVAAGLPDESTLDAHDGGGDLLAVGDLWLAHLAVDAELTPQAVDDDLQMKLAHPRDDGLVRLLVGVATKGRVFVRQLLEGVGELVEVGFRARLDRDADHRLGKAHPFQDDGLLLVTQRVASVREAQPHERVDVAGVADADLLALVGVHA